MHAQQIYLRQVQESYEEQLETTSMLFFTYLESKKEREVKEKKRVRERERERKRDGAFHST